jgi:hypothetical protein
MNYKNEMKLNFTYNSLDINSYKLDNIFKNLTYRDIIQNRDEFGLINTGFQQLFKKNIIFFEGIYKSINNEYNYQQISNLFNKYKYLVILILTKDNKRFGAFYINGNNNNNNQINVINNNYPVANQNNNNIIQQPLPFNGGNEKRINLGIKQNNLYNLQKFYGVQINNGLGQNNNIYMNEKYNNNKNTNTNTSNINIFISSSSLNDYFVFSLDEFKIFYCNNQANANIPIFAILYDANRQTFFGKETLINNQYKLSGKQEFNIKDIELYYVEIGKL